MIPQSRLQLRAQIGSCPFRVLEQIQAVHQFQIGHSRSAPMGCAEYVQP